MILFWKTTNEIHLKVHKVIANPSKITGGISGPGSQEIDALMASFEKRRL